MSLPIVTDSAATHDQGILEVMTSQEIELVASTLEREYRHRFKYRNMWRRLLLYREAQRLREQGLRTKQISLKLTEKYDTKVRSSSVTNWFRRYNPLGRNVIPLATQNLAYVLGAAIGDGSANFTEAELRFQNLRDLDFANALKSSVSCCSWIYKHPNAEIFDVEISNKILMELTAVAKKHPIVLHTVLGSKPEMARAGVRGFFDAEGSGGKFLGAAVTKEEMIDLISTLLDSLSLHHSRRSHEQEVDMISPSNQKAYKRNSRLIHEVAINRCCYHRFSKEIGFSIQRKQMKLEHFIFQNEFRHICR